jgi:hypothetical protein
MTDTNRMRLSNIREVTLGTTPASPRMRAAQITGESLAFQPQSTTSDTIRDDRMEGDPFIVGRNNQGGVNIELIYPFPNGTLSAWLESAFFSTWSQTPERDNDGTADSVITDIGTTANTVAVTTGAAYVVGHLVRHTGFAQAANNGMFAVTTGGATSYVSTGASFVAETAPPAAARSKVVGFQGISGDITATATGLGSTTLNFTTLGLQVGQAVKIGGTGTAFQFAQAANNGFARVTAIAANALTLDNLPTGWTTDAGTSKTIRVFFGDRLRNGTTELGNSIERSFLAQNTPTHIIHRGMIPDQMQLSFQAKIKVTGSFTFMGLDGAQGTVAAGASYDAAPDPALFPAMAGSAHVGRVAEAGAVLTAPNWARSINFTLRNNLRMIEAVDNIAAVDINSGTQTVTAELTAYFGDNSLYAKIMAMTPTSLNWRVERNNRALVFSLPRVTPMSGNPNAGGRNQDVTLPIMLQASRDTLTGFQVLLDRLEYYD